MSRARDLADLGQDKTTLASYVDTGVTSSELDTLDGITSSTVELNKLDGVTSDATDLNRLDITTEGTSQASKVVTADTSGHVTLAGELRGPATLVIDPATVGDESGLLHVKGGLQVDGTTTTINSETLTIDDKNIVLASGAVGGANADGAGITIDGASATMLYTHSTTSFDFNKPINVTGNATLTGSIAVDDIIEKTSAHGVEIDGVVLKDGGGTFTGNVVIPDGGNIGSASDTDALTIDSSGNVGIGTSLSVNNINIDSNKVRTTSSADLKLTTSSEMGVVIVENSGSVRFSPHNTGAIYFDSGTLDLSAQTVDVTLNSAVDALNFDSNTLSIDALNNRIGIGTAAPVAPLTVQSDSGAEAVKILGRSADDIGQMLFVEADGTTRLGRIDARTTYLDIASDSALYLSAGGVGTQSIAIDSSGNVGIGVTSPLSPLHQIDPGSSSAGEIRVGGSSTAFGILIDYDQGSSTTGTIYSSPTYTNSNAVLKLGCGNGNTDQLVLKGDGNVGIGTTSPTYKLETKDGDISAVTLGSAAGGTSVNGIRFRINNSGSQSQFASLGMVSAETESGWGGSLIFSIKPANGSPNESVTEAMRITSSGQLCVGRTSGSGNLNILGSPYIYNLSTGAGTNTLKYNASTGQVTYDTSSERFKENIRDSIYGLNDVLQMRSTQFEYKDDGRSDIGFIAEELNLITPELVMKDSEGRPESVSYDRLVSVLTKAIQELSAKVNALENA